MVRDPRGREAAPDVQECLDALEDPDCRTIIRELEEPMTASELTDRCDIPQSTLYRKLDLLTAATLLEELTEIRSDGHHTARYRVDFEEIRLLLTEDRELDVTIERPARTVDERLADMWTEVGREL